MARWHLVLALVGCSSAAPPPPAQPAPAAPPISAAPPAAPAFDPPAPTLRLPRHFAPASYRVRLAIDPSQPGFAGHVEISGELAQRSAAIWLNAKGLTIQAATAERSGHRVRLTATQRGAELLELRAATPLDAGAWVVSLDYTGTFEDVAAAGAWRTTIEKQTFVLTQFEALSARRVIPCLDEPDRKTPWQLTLDVRETDIAVSNTPIVKTDASGPGHVRVEFAPTPPLPSYLVAFAVGPFEVIDAGATKSGVPIRVIAPPTMAKQTAYLASVEPRIVDFIEGFLGVPFPYRKLDIVVKPRDAGAMENAGMITCDANEALVDPEHPSWAGRHAVISVVGHETAHQWFGDLVTGTWWSDIWLNEAFATWMEPKIELAIDPSWHDEHEAVDQRWAGLASDAQLSARAIAQPVETQDAIQTVFDAVIYMKGASVLRLFERYLGADKFLAGVHAYLVAHANGSATADDLIAALGEASGQQLKPAFDSFIRQNGAPEISIAVSCERGQPARLAFTQRRYERAGGKAPPAGAAWLVPACFAYDHAGKRVDRCALLDGRGEVALADATCPAWVLPNAGGTGYYVANLTAAQDTALRDRAWPQLTALERRTVFDDARRQVFAGRVPFALMMSIAGKLDLADRHVAADVIGDRGLPYGFSRFVPDADRATLAAVTLRRLGTRAHALGLLPRATDTLDDEATRNTVVGVAAFAGDRKLVADAVALAAHDRDLPESSRGLVLALAANASPAVADRLRREAPAEVDPGRRHDLLAALGSIRDPVRLRAQLDVVMAPEIPASDMFALLLQDPGQDAQIVPYLREHYDELRKRFPEGEDFSVMPFLSLLFVKQCSAATRAETAAYLEQNYRTLPAASYIVDGALEELDQCVAEQALVQPALHAWLHAAN